MDESPPNYAKRKKRPDPEKTTHCVIPFMCNSRKCQQISSLDSESRLAAAWGRNWGAGYRWRRATGTVCKGHAETFGGWWIYIHYLTRGAVSTGMYICQNAANYMLKETVYWASIRSPCVKTKTRDLESASLRSNLSCVMVPVYPSSLFLFPPLPKGGKSNLCRRVTVSNASII